MDVPVPGGIASKHHTHDKESTHTILSSVMYSEKLRSDTEGTNARHSSLESMDSSVAATHNFHTFDDQGKAASYLQFFRSPSELVPPPPRHEFDFDVYSTDRTTRTPMYSAKEHTAMPTNNSNEEQRTRLKELEQEMIAEENISSRAPSACSDSLHTPESYRSKSSTYLHSSRNSDSLSSFTYQNL